MKLNPVNLSSIRALNLSLLMVMSLTACGSTRVVPSSGVNQQKIHQSYSVSYDSTNRRSNYLAQFRDGSIWGDTLNLDSGSKVLFQGREMEATKLSDGAKVVGALFPMPFGLFTSLIGGNWYVGKEENIDRVGGESNKFEYTRNDGVVQTYEPKFPMIAKVARVDSMRKSKGFSVELSRGALDKDEKIECYIRSKAPEEVATDPNQKDRYVITQADGARCEFARYKVSAMAKGPAEIFVSARHMTLSSDRMVSLSGEIISKATEVTIED